MAAGRTRLTFKTPVRKQKTPAKQINQQKIKKENQKTTSRKAKKPFDDTVIPPKSVDTKSIENTALKQYLNTIEMTRKKEQDLLANYILENQQLKTINPGHVYTKFTGLEIKNVKDNLYEFCWKIDTKKLVFRLEEEESDYCYEFVECEGLRLPEALMGCINFDKSQYMKFYFNMLEIMLAKPY